MKKNRAKWFWEFKITPESQEIQQSLSNLVVK